MKTTDILTAFLSRLSAFTASPVIPVSWPGIQMEPPSTGMWLEARFFPNQQRDLGWGNTAQVLWIGFCQVLVFYRPGINVGQSSQIDASEIADDVINHFPKGHEMSSVRVLKAPWQSPAVDLDGKSFIPITISYRGIAVVDNIPANAIVDDQGNYVLDDQGNYITL